MPSSTRQWILAKKALSLPTYSGPSPNFQLTTAPLPPITASSVLLKTLWLSNDPAQRTWINANADPERMYTPPVPEGQPMGAFTLSEVIESGDAARLPVGTLVFAPSGWVEYSVQEIEVCQALQPIPGLSLGHFLGALGFTAVTAYYGIIEIAKTTADDTVVVSGAAGATGSMVVQIAKKLIGCKRVIGIAGTDEKCRWVERLGADICINYKKPSFEQDLIRETAGFVEVYFDNVGGSILDLMLTRMKRHGRIAACGTISNYNRGDDPIGLKNFFEVVSNRINIQGLIVLDYLHKSSEVVSILANAWQEGKIIIDDSLETVVEAQFDEIPSVWLKLFEGGNTGKLLTKLISTE